MPPENEEARQAVALADLLGFCETQAPSIPDELILPRPVDAGRQAADPLVLAAALILGQGSNGQALRRTTAANKRAQGCREIAATVIYPLLAGITAMSKAKPCILDRQL
jgi:hypothetical protein